jgi:hypothetical protein
MDDHGFGRRTGQLDGGAAPGSSAGWFPPPADSGAPPPPPPPPASLLARRRNRNLRVAGIVAAALIAGLAVGVPVGLLSRASTPSSTAAQPPGSSSATATKAKALYRQALTAAAASAGCHYVSVSSGGSTTQRFVGDAGQHAGGQTITLDSTFGTENFALTLVSGTVYFQGNIPALEDQLGVPATSAAGDIGKWISVASNDGPFGVVAPGITVGDQASEMLLVATSTLPVTTGNSTRATRIGGTVPAQNGAPAGTGHLDINADTHLPVAYVTVISDAGVTITSTTTFTAWGTAPTAAAPAGAIAWSTLGASMPPGGYGGSGGLTPTPSSGA